MLMSSREIAIRVKNLSKCYQVYDRPNDRLKQSFYPRLQRIVGRHPKQYYHEFWALQGISFEVQRGDALGIIGRNGSGKSTLLQIICGTLAPTAGEVVLDGRVAALLELGSGFNPEFTGRENVYLNASILGLTKDEIDSRFEAITAFADIGDFIDQPVKTYSSGMFVRLAFAVVVHVDADILIVDEALSVGDAFFTQKCMTKIKELRNSGITLLFVSHDSNAVKALCSKALLLDKGGISFMGNTNSVVDHYYGAVAQEQQENLVSLNGSVDSCENEVNHQTESIFNNEAFQKRAVFHRLQNGKAEFFNIQLFDNDWQEIQEVAFCQPVILRMVVKTNSILSTISLAYHIRDKNGYDLVYSDSAIESCNITDTKVNEFYIIDWEFRISLKEGNYTIATMLSIPIDLSIGKVEICDFIPIACQFKVGRGNSLPLYGAVYWNNSVKSHFIETSAKNHSGN